ncbi:hypothetical protein SLA2020_435560 [Shorea laevis]
MIDLQQFLCESSAFPREEENFPRVTCDEENTLEEYIGGVDATGFSGEKAHEKSGILMIDIVSHEERIMQENGAPKLRKRPSMLVVPAFSADEMEFGEMGRKLANKEFEVEGKNFVLASKKGRRTTVMEDGYGVMLDLLGDPKQALFAVIDGHGGHAAADYVAENLGRNIVKALEYVGEEERLEQAIRRGYLVTDKEFLSQGVRSGACAASVHRLSREDERRRIENSGGFVHCCNGVWRVQGTLAVSRAIGDFHLKQWIISEPEIKKLPLTSDCEFLIMASDGLWDKVNDQEAVDVVLREKNMLMACKKLVDMSCSRGNMDDITVMVINLQNFVVSG